MFQVISAARSCPTLCDPMDCSVPGLPVHHQLLEFAQTHVCVPKPNLKKKILGIQLKPFLVALHSDSSLTALRSASHETRVWNGSPVSEGQDVVWKLQGRPSAGAWFSLKPGPLKAGRIPSHLCANPCCRVMPMNFKNLEQASVV